MTSESAKALARRLFEECWGAGKADVLPEVMAKNHIFHLAEGEVEGREPYRGILEAYRRAFAPRYSLPHVIAEGDLAVVHYVEEGRFAGVWTIGEQEIQPTGKAYRTFGVEMVRVQEGRIVESWPGHEALAQYTQIGIVKIGG